MFQQSPMKDRRLTQGYTFPMSLHDAIESHALQHTGGNKSAFAERLIRKGAEAVGIDLSAPPQPSPPAGRAANPDYS